MSKKRKRKKNKYNSSNKNFLTNAQKKNQNKKNNKHKKNIMCYQSEENEILEFIKSNYSGEVIHEDKKILENKELDIVIPEFKLAIEFDGLFFHDEKNKGKKYHLEKTLLTKKAGYKLIHIFENEWLNHKEIVKGLLLSLLNINETINARETFIKEIDNLTLINNFLKENDLNGEIKSFRRNIDKCIAFRKKSSYNNEIILLVIIKKNTKGNYYIERYVPNKLYTLKGFPSKLAFYIRHRLKYIKRLTYKIDMRYDNSLEFTTQGFKFCNYLPPKAWLFNSNNRNTEIFDLKNFTIYDIKRFDRKAYQQYVQNKENVYLEEVLKKTSLRKIYDCGYVIIELNN